MDYNPSGFSVDGPAQAGTLEWVAISFSRGPSQPRDPIHVSCLAGRFFPIEPPGKPILEIYSTTIPRKQCLMQLAW